MMMRPKRSLDRLLALNASGELMAASHALLVQDRIALVTLGMPNGLKGTQATSSVSGTITVGPSSVPSAFA
jgi:hypothetical protein